MSAFRPSRSGAVYVFILVVACLLFFVLNVLTTLKGDDIVYALIPGDESQRCTTLWQFIASQPHFYNDINGRTADIIERLFASLLGKGLFNVCNTMVFAVLVDTMVRTATAGRRSVWALTLTLAFFGWLFPLPGETMLWMAGACNYLWALTASVVLFYVLSTRPAGRRAGAIEHTLVAIAAFISGSMNESISLAALLGMVGYFAFRPQRLRGVIATAMVAYAVGVLVILCSPALWNRLEQGGSVDLHVGAMQLLSRRLLNTATKTAHFVTPAIAFAMMVWQGVRHGRRSVMAQPINWVLIGALLTVVGMSMSKYRAYTCYSAVSYMVVLGGLAQWMERRHTWQRAVAVVAVVACLWPAYRAVTLNVAYSAFDRQAVADIINAPSQCVIAAREFSPRQSRWVVPNIYDNEGYFPYKPFYCIYYGKEAIEFLRPELLARYRSSAALTDGAAALPYRSDTPLIADTIYAIAGQPYSLMPVAREMATSGNDLVHLYFDDLTAHLGAERAARLKRWGELKDFEQRAHYHLLHGGRHYIVLPPIDSTVVRLTVPLHIDHRRCLITFTRQAPNP